jgi:hypothetical protein
VQSWVRADPDRAVRICASLLAAVHSRKLATHSCGNFVMQVLFEAGRAETLAPLINHLLNHGRYLSLHKYGCRVMQRALPHMTTEQRLRLHMDLGPLSDVAAHDYGNYTLQKFIVSEPSHSARQVLLTQTFPADELRVLEGCWSPKQQRLVFADKALRNARRNLFLTLRALLENYEEVGHQLRALLARQLLGANPEFAKYLLR